MSKYKYGGYILQEIPARNKEIYPYVYVSVVDSSGYAYVVFTDKLGYIKVGESSNNIYTLGLTSDDEYDETKMIRYCDYVIALNESAVTNLSSTWPGISTTSWLIDGKDEEVMSHAADGGPHWSNVTIKDENGDIFITGSDPVKVVPNIDHRSLSMGIAIGQSIRPMLSTTGGSAKGEAVCFTLSAGNWNGTTYQITVSEYGEIKEGLQIGIPPTSSAANAEKVIKAALTIPRFENETKKVDTDGDGENDTYVYSQTIITISAVTAPTNDIEIAIWGLI